MRIGVNLLPLRDDVGGMRQYVGQLIPGLVAASDHHFVLFHARAGSSLVDEMLASLGGRELSRTERVLIERPEDVYAHAGRFELYFCPLNGLAPDLLDRPTVATLADVLDRYHPEYFTAQQLRLRAQLYPRTAQAATTLITISEFSRQGICRRLQVPGDKVAVTHLAPGDDLLQATSTWPDDLPRLPGRFVFYPANLYPHKNHGLLLQALRILKERGTVCGAIFTGHPVEPGFHLEEQIAASGLTDRALWLRYVPLPALRFLYEHAAALCFPSQFEGFGLPLVEAMHFGCPVLAAAAASIPEIAGGAAWYLEPNAGEWAGAIERLLDDAELRLSMIDAGRKRAAAFNSQILVAHTLQLLDAAPARHAPPQRTHPLTFVVDRGDDQEGLTSTLDSVRREWRQGDELLIAGPPSSEPPLRRAPHGVAAKNLFQNSVCSRIRQNSGFDARILANSATVGDGFETVAKHVPRRGWVAAVRNEFVCVLRGADRLCAGACATAIAQFAKAPAAAAVVGEALACDPGGTPGDIRFVPALHGVQVDGAQAPPGAVFWRREFLVQNAWLLKSFWWANLLLHRAGPRVCQVQRTFALVDRQAEARLRPGRLQRWGDGLRLTLAIPDVGFKKLWRACSRSLGRRSA